MVPDRTLQPRLLTTGALSPVIAASLTVASPDRTVPSTGTTAPAPTTTASPAATSSAEICTSTPSRRTQTPSLVGRSRCLSRSSERRAMESSIASPSARMNVVVLAATKSDRASEIDTAIASSTWLVTPWVRRSAAACRSSGSAAARLTGRRACIGSVLVPSRTASVAATSEALSSLRGFAPASDASRPAIVATMVSASVRAGSKHTISDAARGLTRAEVTPSINLAMPASRAGSDVSERR